MKENELRPARRSKKSRKKVGRGDGSGHGTTSGRGTKGQNSRSGGGVRPGFEGGQLPLIVRLPRKRGFHNPGRVEYAWVNVGALSRFPAGTEVTPETLRRAGLARGRRPLKVLGNGSLDVPLKVTADRFSRTAREKIEAAGGEVIQRNNV